MTCASVVADGLHGTSGGAGCPVSPWVRVPQLFLSSVLLRCCAVTSGEEADAETGLPAVSVGPCVYQALDPCTARRTPSSSLLPSDETGCADSICGVSRGWEGTGAPCRAAVRSLPQGGGLRSQALFWLVIKRRLVSLVPVLLTFPVVL